MCDQKLEHAESEPSPVGTEPNRTLGFLDFGTVQRAPVGPGNWDSPNSDQRSEGRRGGKGGRFGWAPEDQNTEQALENEQMENVMF